MKKSFQTLLLVVFLSVSSFCFLGTSVFAETNEPTTEEKVEIQTEEVNTVEENENTQEIVNEEVNENENINEEAPVPLQLTNSAPLLTTTTNVEPDTSWYVDGKGTSSDNPYILKNIAQLEGLAKLVNSAKNFNGKYIKLADDFDNSVALKTVIGNANGFKYEGSDTVRYYEFRGHFDGNSKEVKLDLSYNSTSNYYHFGMFGKTNGAEISNLTVSGEFNIVTTLRIYCGGLVGYADKTNITNCCSKVNITAETTSQHAYCGALVGNFIYDSESDGTSSGTIIDSYTTGNVTSKTTTKTAMAGGIAGSVTKKGSVINCYSRGDMTANTNSGIAYAAGIAGMNQDTILSCYSTGSMNATKTAGTAYAVGLAGSNTGIVRKSYSVCETFVGTGTGTLETSYVIDADSKMLLPKKTVSLLDQLNANADKFDLVSWRIIDLENDNYPIYRYPKYAASIGDTKYKTVQKAIDSCPTDALSSTTIKLLGDIDERISVTDKRNIVLDLNGNCLTAHGEEFSTNDGAIIYVKNGTLLITNGLLKNADNGYDVSSNNGTVSITNCQLKGSFNTSDNGEIKVSSGTIFSTYIKNRFIDDSMRITLNTDSKTKATYPYTLKSVTTDISWYDSSKATYVLSDTADLEGFAKLVNNGITFEGKTIKLSNEFSDTTPLTTIIADYGLIEDVEQVYAEFLGTFNGNSKKVKIDIDVTFATSTVFAGMFGEINNAKISNLTVEGTLDVKTKRKVYVGGLVGYIKGNSEIYKCSTNVVINSTVNGENHGYVGGIAGQLANAGKINKCNSKGAVNSTTTTKTAMAAGIVGAIENSGTVINCYSTGAMSATSTSGRSYAAGLVGMNANGSVLNSYSTGDITAVTTSGSAYAAGLVGINQPTKLIISVFNCYSKNNLEATETSGQAYKGGLVGYNDHNSRVNNSFSVYSNLFGWDGSVLNSNTYTIDESIQVGVAGKKSLLVTWLEYETKKNNADEENTKFLRWKVDSKGYPVFGNAEIASVEYEDGTVNYQTIQEAIDAIADKGITKETTITLLKDTEECISISSGQNIILNLNSKKLTAAAAFESNYSYSTIAVENGSLKIKDGLLSNVINSGTSGAPGAIKVSNNGELTEVNGVIINVENTSDISDTRAVGIYSNESNTDIVNSSITVSSKSDAMGIYNYGGNFKITNTIVNSKAQAVQNNTASTVIVSGKYTGTIYSTNKKLKIQAGLFSERPDNEYIDKGKQIVLNTDKVTRYDYTYQVIDDVKYDTSWYSEEGGSSATDPYLLHNTAQLEGLAKYVNNYGYSFKNKYIKLADDFDGSVALKTVIGNGNWLIIDPSNPESMFSATFKGNFDGNSKEVKIDLYYSGNTATLVSGMFGLVECGKISNLTVSGDINILTTRKVYCGGLAARVSNTIIDTCVSKVNIDVETTSENNYCGGLVANLSGGGLIVDSYATGNVKAKIKTSKAIAGGIVAQIEKEGTIKNSYSRGDVKAVSTSGESYVGGIVGINQDKVLSCYSTGTMSATSTSGTAYAAGLAGSNTDTGYIRKSYCVSETYVGTNAGTLETSYKIDETSRNLYQKSGSSFVDTGVSLLDQLNANALKFGLTWWKVVSGINNGYPIHDFEKRVAYINFGTEEDPDIKYYYSLQDAVDACPEHNDDVYDTIVMINDSVENIEITKKYRNIIIDLNGKTLTADTTDPSDVAVISINPEDTYSLSVIVKNGTIEAKYSGAALAKLCGIDVNSAKLSISEVNIYIVNNSTNSSSSSIGLKDFNSPFEINESNINVSSNYDSFGVDYSADNKVGNPSINNSNISSSNIAIENNGFVLSVDGGKYKGILKNSVKSSFYISSGLFSEKVEKNKLSLGRECVNNTDILTMFEYPYKVIYPKVAEVNGTQYQTLQEAVDAAELLGTESSPAIVKLIDNAEIDRNVTIDNGKYVTFNLNGYKVTSFEISKRVTQDSKGFYLVDRLVKITDDTLVLIPEENVSFKEALEIANTAYPPTFRSFEILIVYSQDTKYNCVYNDKTGWDSENSYSKTLDEIKEFIEDGGVAYVIGETHIHKWTYEQGTTKDTIIATCQNLHCPEPSSTMTLKLVMDSHLVYDGKPKEAKVIGAAQGFEVPEITYYIDSDFTIETSFENSGASEEGGAPVKLGTYYVKTDELQNSPVLLYAKAKSAGVWMETSFTIKNADPIVNPDYKVVHTETIK